MRRINSRQRKLLGGVVWLAHRLARDPFHFAQGGISLRLKNGYVQDDAPSVIGQTEALPAGNYPVTSRYRGRIIAPLWPVAGWSFPENSPVPSNESDGQMSKS